MLKEEIVIALFLFLFGCERSPVVEHDKLAATCRDSDKLEALRKELEITRFLVLKECLLGCDDYGDLYVLRPCIDECLGKMVIMHKVDLKKKKVSDDRCKMDFLAVDIQAEHDEFIECIDRTH